jgi:hypothetical protein
MKREKPELFYTVLAWLPVVGLSAAWALAVVML